MLRRVTNRFAGFNLEQWLQQPVNETTPLLLDLVRRQAARRRPSQLLAQYLRDATVAPSSYDLRTLHRLDSLGLDAAHEYEAVSLSPVAPLGSCSALAPTSQDRTLSCLRGAEVVSDPTNVLALEAARRLKAGSRHVRLCTVHQVLRMQPFPKRAGLSRHFRMFALIDAGHGLANEAFEVAAIVAQLRVFDALFDAAIPALGCAFPRRRIVLRSTSARAALQRRVGDSLTRELTHVEVAGEPLDAAYYDGLRISFGANTQQGEYCPIGDLGLFDWMAKLTSNQRMRLIASGFGLQLLPTLFAAAPVRGS